MYANEGSDRVSSADRGWREEPTEIRTPIRRKAGGWREEPTVNKTPIRGKTGLLLLLLVFLRLC